MATKVLEFARLKSPKENVKLSTNYRQTHAIIARPNGHMVAACGLEFRLGFTSKGKGRATCRVCQKKTSILTSPVNPPPQASNLRSMGYDEYLNTPHWKQVRNRTLAHWGHRCCVCYRDKALHVHHRTYRRKGAEYLTDCIVLCKECHTLHHCAMRDKPREKQ